MIPYSRQYIDQDDIDAVVATLKSDYLTQGAKIEEFEEALVDYTGAKYAVAVSSGTAALHLGVLAMGMKAGKIGITSPISFAASANCFLYAGGDVKFTDVDPKTGLMDVESLREAIESCSEPGVVIPVSLQGQVPRLADIQAIAHSYGWIVLEDAAHSLGATYDVDGRIFKSGSCSHTDAAILSFHPLKHICTGEGGAFLTNSRELAEEVRLLRSHSIVRPSREGEPSWFYEQVGLGFNYRMTDIQAALGISQLKRLTLFLNKRREIAEYYRKSLSSDQFLNVFELSPADNGHAYHLFVLLFSTERLRNEAHEYLKANNFATQIHYRPIYQFPYYEQKYGTQYFIGAETYYKTCLSVSMYYIISQSEQDELITILGLFCEKFARIRI